MGRFVASLLVVVFLTASKSQAQDDPATNVVLILIDDLGWRDLGCYGSDYYQTPNIDRLAAEGVRFTDAYSACNVCSPSRAAIMTGKYPARLMLTQWLPAGRWDREKHRMREGRYLANLPLEEITIAEALREAEFQTCFIGKWHLGTETYYYPEHQGFDVNIAGRDYGAPGHYFYPFEGSWEIPTTGKKLVKSSPIEGKEGDYLIDRMAEEADEFIRGHADSRFFVMLSHYAVHAPLQAKPEMTERFEAVPKRDRQGNPRYAAMVASVDESVGRVMRALQETGTDKNTLVLFTSDNGGFAKATQNRPLRANKGSNYEGGLRVPMIARWPAKIPAGGVSSTPVIGNDLYPTILDATGLRSRPHQHVDGENLMPLMSSNARLNRKGLFWHYPHYNRHPESFPSSVVRAGKWKLIENLETGDCELFDLEADLGEQRNLAAELPERKEELLSLLHEWRDEVGADPMKVNPEYEGQ